MITAEENLLSAGHCLVGLTMEGCKWGGERLYFETLYLPRTLRGYS